MFNRKMKTKLPQIQKKEESEMDKEIREKHDREKEKQKSYADKKRRSEEKEVKEGDKVLIKRKKTTTKSPWDPDAYKVKEVKGDRLKLERNGSKLDRAKGKVKVVPERPEIFKRKERERRRVETESEVDMSKLRRRFQGNDPNLKKNVKTYSTRNIQDNSKSKPKPETIDKLKTLGIPPGQIYCLLCGGKHISRNCKIYPRTYCEPVQCTVCKKHYHSNGACKMNNSKSRIVRN